MYIIFYFYYKSNYITILILEKQIKQIKNETNKKNKK